jgi:hypothetical protein
VTALAGPVIRVTIEFFADRAARTRLGDRRPRSGPRPPGAIAAGRRRRQRDARDASSVTRGRRSSRSRGGCQASHGLARRDLAVTEEATTEKAKAGRRQDPRRVHDPGWIGSAAGGPSACPPRPRSVKSSPICGLPHTRRSPMPPPRPRDRDRRGLPPTTSGLNPPVLVSESRRS